MSIFLLSILSSAGAAELDCASLDAEACATANHIAGVLNTHVGEVLIDVGAPQKRFDTLQVYRKVAQIRSNAVTAGCSIDGIMVGAYDADFSFDGHWESADATQNAFLSGDYRIHSELMAGSYTGDSSGTIGDLFGTPLGNGRILTNKDDEFGFLAGQWTRLVGMTGVWYGVTGSCGGSSADAMAGWFGRTLSRVTFDAVAPMLREGCAECHSADLGTNQAPLIGSADPMEAYLATQEECLPGTTCGELAITLINVGLKPPAPRDRFDNVDTAKLDQWLAGGMLAP